MPVIAQEAGNNPVASSDGRLGEFGGQGAQRDTCSSPPQPSVSAPQGPEFKGASLSSLTSVQRISKRTSVVKTLLPMQETWVGSLGGEDPLEEGMATHSRILAWRIPWTEEPGGLQSTGSQSRTRLSDRAQAGERPALTRSRPEKEGLLSVLLSAPRKQIR